MNMKISNNVSINEVEDVKMQKVETKYVRVV